MEFKPQAPTPGVPEVKKRSLLQLGSAGDEVKDAQKALGFTGKDVDGIFGKKTFDATKAFQRSKNVLDDGKIGPQTWALLGFK